MAGPCHPTAGAAALVQCCDSFFNTEHGNGKSGLDGRHGTVAERMASCLGQRSWALLSVPWGWVDTGEAGVDLGEG